MLVEEAPFVFVVDTDSYSGNFERELATYMTGIVEPWFYDEEQEADREDFRVKFPEEFKQFDEIVLFISDDEENLAQHACVFPTPGRFNDGFGSHWDINTDLQIVKEKRDEYIRANYDGEEMERRLKTPVGNYPAYESVAVAFSESPNEAQIELMKNRAQEYATKTESFAIKGFRLIENEKVIITTSRAV